jgi:CRISPR-associated protein Csm1
MGVLMKTELQIVVLAALLHDIGKFCQRARRPFSKEMEASYLTYQNGKSGHWHTLYTDYFIEHDLPLPVYLESERGRIARYASAHHRPDDDNVIEMAITLADRMSAGTDRIAYQADDDHTGFRSLRLLSIFDEVELSRHHFEEPGHWYYTLMSLETENDSIFPLKEEKKGDPEEYKNLFDRFHDAIHKLDATLPYPLYLDSLVSILEKYTWCIPSSTYKTLPDISLFDHSLMTATIAQALYLYHAESDTVPKENDQDEKFVLLGGDLSGIQDYIFKISRNTGKGVSKIFRARSFYLQAVVKSALISLQNRLGILGACRVMDAGGKFLLLLPNLDIVKNTVSMWEKDLQKWFRREFKGLLTLNIGKTTVMKQGDFTLSQFQKKLDGANESIDRAKYAKLNLTIKSNGPLIDSDYDEREGGNCSICNAKAMDVLSTNRPLKN